MTNRDLEARLVAFSVNIIRLTDTLRTKPATKSLVEQIRRSASAAALNYGEAQSAESKKDFIHKAGIVLKELRETFINLSIIISLEKLEGSKDNPLLEARKENDELIAIFYKTILTAKKNDDSSSTK